MYRIACDAHTHTLWSRHAYSTIEENVRTASIRGIELLGSTDHFGAMIWPSGSAAPSDDARDYQYFRNYGVWPRVWHGVRLLHGCEADIADLEGHLMGHDVELAHDMLGNPFEERMTLEDYVLSECDYAIASVHDSSFCRGASRAELTSLYVKALENPKVLILGHAGRSGLDFEVRPVARAAHDLHKMIEINESTFLKDHRHDARCREILETCAEEGALISTGTDAHISKDVGRFDATEALLSDVEFPEELLATRSAEAFMDGFHAAGLELLPTERD